MNYIQKLLLSPNTVFTTQDIKLLWQDTPVDQVKQYVQYHVNNNNLTRVQRGVFVLPNRKPNPFELGNKLRSPSYISFESVLFKEGIIFQWDEQIRLASNQSIKLTALDYEYVFTQLKDDILLDPTGVKTQNNVHIATKERAILDSLYINPLFHFDNVRNIDFGHAFKIAQVYKTKSIIDALKKWESHAQSL